MTSASGVVFSSLARSVSAYSIFIPDYSSPKKGGVCTLEYSIRTDAILVKQKM
jgi:hypothetical protein